MFSDKQKEAYSAVKAPDELRERILASAEETKKDNTVLFKTQFSRILAAAACIVLVTVAAFYAFNGNGIDINVNGASVAENASVALAETHNGVALARAAGDAEVRVSIDIKGDAFITVDSGSFDVVGKESGLTEYSAEESVEVIWKSDGMKKSEMTVDYGRRTSVLVLEYDGEWIITRK